MLDQATLRPGGTVGWALRGLAHDILTEARIAVDDPARSDAEAVHGFRKAMKSWRAHLRLLRPFLGEEAIRLQVQARDLARTLAGARDAQAALDALSEIEQDNPDFSARSFATIREKINALRTEKETASVGPTVRRQLSETLANAGHAVDHWPLGEVTFPDVADRLTAGYRAARRLIPHDWFAIDAEQLHELRQKVVRHRYQMELMEPLWPRFAKMWMGEAQRIRDRLGMHQDLEVLTHLTAPRQPLARWRAKLAPMIEKCQADQVARAAALSHLLFAEPPRAFRRRLIAIWRASDPELDLR